MTIAPRGARPATPRLSRAGLDRRHGVRGWTLVAAWSQVHSDPEHEAHEGRAEPAHRAQPAFATTVAGLVGIAQLPARAYFAAHGRPLSPAALLAGVFRTVALAAALTFAADAAVAVVASGLGETATAPPATARSARSAPRS